MKKVFFAILTLAVCFTVTAQQKPEDGIYLVEKLYHNNSKMIAATERTIINYNPLFVDDSPEEYFPIIAAANEFVPFHLNTLPVIRSSKNKRKSIFLQLNDAASARLYAFTLRHLGKYAVFVVNGLAVRVVKIDQKVSSGVIQIVNCTDKASEEIIPQLSAHVIK